MKKLFFVMITVAVAVCFAACKNEAANDGQKAEAKVESAAATNNDVKAVTLDDVKAIAEKAKKEGANWSVDQWKDATRQMMAGMKPMYDALKELQEKAQDKDFQQKLKDDPAETTKMLGDLKKKLEEYAPLEGFMRDFSDAAEASEAGKKMMDDKAFMEELKNEFGFPERAF
ncbi:MAG: hypothetical protein IJ632_00130 [Muribaculaceae bacterium]|nr:hypothetical protein [Muribaculaceae bacterium]